jgi:uncharacterized protein (UPF0333 family)
MKKKIFKWSILLPLILLTFIMALPYLIVEMVKEIINYSLWVKNKAEQITEWWYEL